MCHPGSLECIRKTIRDPEQSIGLDPGYFPLPCKIPGWALQLFMNFKYEKSKLAEGFHYIIGCDEVGRGCLAGPVVAGAVVFPVDGDKLKVHKVFKVIKDSKLLTPQKREDLSAIIKNIALAWSIAEVSSEEVDKINIHNASLLAMKKAVEGLMCHCEEVGALADRRGNLTSPGVILNPNASESEESQKEILRVPLQEEAFVFIDGKFPIPNLNLSQQAIIGGDNKVLSIAAASIIAKVYRDNLMREFDKQYPKYELAKHKGYATLQHRKIIIKNGLSPIHRLSFCSNYL